jgi:hypothetical protein
MAAKISLFVSGWACRRRISRIAWRGLVILCNCPRKRPVSADNFCRLCEWERVRTFIAITKSHRRFPKTSSNANRLQPHSHKKPPDYKHPGAAESGYFISNI